MDSLPTAVFRNGSTICIDHFKMDGAKLAQQGVSLDKSPGRAPARYIYKARVKHLVRKNFTKYEVFCARLGRTLQKQYPRLTTLRHTIVDHRDTRFVVFGNASTAFVDAPIGLPISIKTLRRNRLFGYGGLELIWYMYGPREDSVIMVKDWRFLHDKLNLNIDHPAVDMYGHEARSWMVTILKTNDTYYAVGPTGLNRSASSASSANCARR
jgi:hypothetical protein